MMEQLAGHEGTVPVKNRDGGIDILKGILVIGMIWTHALQFFADSSSVTASWIETYGNVTSYAGFVFCFGYANQIAYFSRPFARSWQRMLRTAFKILIAFYLSGSFFRVFVSQEPASWSTVSQILVLNDIPGWSEFLAGFFALTVFAVCFFRPLVWLVERKRWFWPVFFGLLATTFFPYGAVGPDQLGLFVGSTHFASFSVLQYLPYYLAGMYLARHRIVFQYRLLAGAAAGTALFAAYAVASGGQLPTRFTESLAVAGAGHGVDGHRGLSGGIGRAEPEGRLRAARTGSRRHAGNERSSAGSGGLMARRAGWRAEGRQGVVDRPHWPV